MPEPWNERAVVCGLQAGDREAWTLLYSHHSERVWRYVARLIGLDRAAVADIVQETFVSAARSARRFDPSRGTLAQWLLGIAHNQVSHHWKSVVRQSSLREIAATNGKAEVVGGETMNPVALLENAETAESVRVALASLSPDYAVLLAGKYLDDLSIDDLVELHGGTTEALRSRLARARREFREAYARCLGVEGLTTGLPTKTRRTPSGTKEEVRE